MTRSILLRAALVLMVAGMFGTACGGVEVEIDDQLLGYWISSDPEGGLYIDGDGYGWGYEIARNGDLTVARLDWHGGFLNTEANGPFGRLLTASNGIWELEIDGEGTSQGTYSLSTVTSSSEDVHPFLTVSMGGTEYLVKVAELE